MASTHHRVKAHTRTSKTGQKVRVRGHRRRKRTGKAHPKPTTVSPLTLF